MLIRICTLVAAFLLAGSSVQAANLGPASSSVFVRPIVYNYTSFWWHNFRDPSYCTMFFCDGACAYRHSSCSGEGVDVDYDACRLVPLYPILDSTSCCKEGACH